MTQVKEIYGGNLTFSDGGYWSPFCSVEDTTSTSFSLFNQNGDATDPSGSGKTAYYVNNFWIFNKSSSVTETISLSLGSTLATSYYLIYQVTIDPHQTLHAVTNKNPFITSGAGNTSDKLFVQAGVGSAGMVYYGSGYELYWGA
jgi:hypothetical protein